MPCSCMSIDITQKHLTLLFLLRQCGGIECKYSDVAATRVVFLLWKGQDDDGRESSGSSDDGAWPPIASLLLLLSY